MPRCLALAIALAACGSDPSGDETATSSTSSSDSASGGFDDYDRCWALGFHPKDPTECSASCVQNAIERRHACAPSCDPATPCPQPAGGSAHATCVEDRCILDCTQGDCPAGMECIVVDDLADTSACLWPSQWLAPYGPCTPDVSPPEYCIDVEAGICGQSGLVGGPTVCGPRCWVDGDACPQPATGTAPAVCREAPPFCILDCTQGVCPDGMECLVIDYGLLTTPACMWRP
jgi:hypothetical protein